jgi:uncharacterized protein (TIGR02231 family)
MFELEAPIREVTVYSDRALVTRRGSIALEPGEHELRVNHLPRFIKDSLRATGLGPPGTRLLSVEVTRAFLPRPPEADLLTLQTACDLLTRQIELLVARRVVLDERRSWLRSLGEQSREIARGVAQGQIHAQDCAEFFTFLTDQALQDAQTTQDIDVQLKQLREELEARQRELASKRRDSSPDRLAALVVVSLATAGEVTLELSYLIEGASWHPTYDVHVQSTSGVSEGEVDLTYAGVVQQSTGEHWEQVTLALSTARPALAAVLPELKPWYLDIAVPLPPRPPAASSGVRSYAMLQPLASMPPEAVTSSAALPESQEVGVVTAEVEQTATALVFRVGHAVDIPSDNSPHRTIVAHDRLPCTFDAVCAPALEEQAHLRATIKNTTERVLLKGEASIFMQNEYVGTTLIKMTAPQEEFQVFLGVDDGIKVKRELSERAVDKGSLLQSGLRRITYAYHISVHNYTSYERRVEVLDHLPVSRHERVKVRILGLSPAPHEHTKLEILTWTFHLPPGAAQQIQERFLVEHPQETSVTGLP